MLAPDRVAQNVLQKFDGRYVASVVRANAVGVSNGNVFAVVSMAIERGRIVVDCPGAGIVLDGCVDDSGILSGALYRPGAPPLSFQGQMLDGIFRGGVIDEAGACVWMIALERE